MEYEEIAEHLGTIRGQVREAERRRVAWAEIAPRVSARFRAIVAATDDNRVPTRLDVEHSQHDGGFDQVRLFFVRERIGSGASTQGGTWEVAFDGLALCYGPTANGHVRVSIDHGQLVRDPGSRDAVTLSGGDETEVEVVEPSSLDERRVDNHVLQFLNAATDAHWSKSGHDVEF